MLNIRPATTADIPLIRELAAQAFPATYRHIITPAQIAFMMDWMYSPAALTQQMTTEGHHFYIAEVETTPVGYVSLRREDADTFHLEKLYVLPSAQGKHVGRSLFNHALTVARAAGGRCVELNVNRYNRAVGFYEHIGMRRVREGDFPIGDGFFMNDYIMAIDL